jgi:hypothetical protein
MTTPAEYPRVHYLARLPEYWIVRSAPDAYWLVGDRQPWTARRRYGGPTTGLLHPSPQTARLVLEQFGLSTGAYAPPNESRSQYETIIR